MYMVIELAKGGELYEYVAQTGFFQPEVARSYFHQLIEALEYCHGQGITH
jgi:serine/threonine protein kinase